MVAKAIVIFCAQALLIQSALSQCLGRTSFDNFGWPAPGLTGGLTGLSGGLTGLSSGLAFPAGYGGLSAPSVEFSPTSGGGLAVTSASAIPPTGISVMSENVYEGGLSVAGELPFVGTTGMEGVLATAGAGAINHACGNGINAMSALSDTSSPASVASAGGPAFNAPSLAYNGPFAPGFGPAAFGAPAIGAFGSPALAAPCNAALAGRGLGYDGLIYGSPFDVIETTPTSGGALPVSSASAVPPTGIAVASENVYEGPLAAGGELPFVGSVAVDGLLPTAGAGAVNHACGNGRNAMISEGAAFSPAAAGYAPALGAPFGYSAGLGNLAYPAGLAGAAAPGLGLRGGWAGRGCGVL